MPRIQVREPSWLGLSIEAPTETVRATPREADALDVPLRQVVRTDPHGFGPGDFVLPRPEGRVGEWTEDRVRRWMYAPVRSFDQDDRTVHESRISRHHVGASEITLETEGFSKTLEDEEQARELIRSADLGAYQGTGKARRVALGTGLVTTDGQVLPADSGVPELRIGWGPQTLASGLDPLSELWQDAGVEIGEIDYAVEGVLNVSFADANYDFRVGGSTTGLSSTQDTGDLQPDYNSGSKIVGTRYTLSLTPGLKWAFANLQYNPGAGAWTRDYILRLLLALWGRHGITRRGAWPNEGVFASDVAPYLVSKYAPLLRVTSRSVEPTAFVIPHLVWPDPTKPAEMLDGLALFGGVTFLPLDWYVFNDRTFEMKSPDNHGRVWQLRIDKGVEPSEAGDDGSERINGVYMTYTDGAGAQHSVGPPGSGADTETTALFDNRPDNPVNMAKGADKRTRAASMGITYEAGAILAAQSILADANRRRWRGDIEVKTYTRLAGGGEEPPYMIHSFDRGVVENGPDVAERRINNTEYSTETGVNKLSIGAPPDRFETLLARTGVVLEGKL